MSQLTNKEMLQFIHDRMIHVHGDNENADFMHGLRRVMKAMEAAEARVAELEGFADDILAINNGTVTGAEGMAGIARKALNTGEKDGE